MNVIAIDGPAGSGKSTVAWRVAKEINYLYIDTGAIYRALTLKAMNEKANLSDKGELAALSEKADIRLEADRSRLKVFLDGKDVSESIRSMDVTASVKHLASVKGVRKNMVRLQRRLAEGSKGAVLEGRDIGTVVFPDAKHKFYLDASLDVRVGRRFKELKEKGCDISEGEVKEDVMARDASDMTRSEGPLKKADDAVRVDTTGMTVDEVVKQIVTRLKPPG